MVEDEKHPDSWVTVSVDDCQRLTEMEDGIAHVLLCLESTSDTIATLGSIFVELLQSQKDHSTLEKSVPPLANPALDRAFMTAERQVSYTKKKAEALLSKIRSTRELVSLPKRLLSSTYP